MHLWTVKSLNYCWKLKDKRQAWSVVSGGVESAVADGGATEAKGKPEVQSACLCCWWVRKFRRVLIVCWSSCFFQGSESSMIYC